MIPPKSLLRALLRLSPGAEVEVDAEYTDEEGEQMTPQAGFRLKIAKTGSEAAIVASFNEATGFDVDAEATEMKRSLPNGKTRIMQPPQTFIGSVP